MNKKSFYITTTLPYVNSDPHIGFAMEIIRADVIARYKKELGCDVFFNTGTDEHGAKIFENAVKAGITPQEFVDISAQKFKDLILLLNISESVHFIRTTDKKHILSAQEMWKKCFENEDIYKKEYKTKYCVGCELEKTDSELVNGKCPIHANREIEIREEENYFFKFSKYQKQLLDLYNSNPHFVIPDFRFNEIKSFVDRGLEDFSISRLKTKMPWGVPVPNDDTQVMYVWFDALTNYISTLDWPNGENYKKYWEQEGSEKREVVQYCGKDNLRQQSAMWQAMLMSAGIPNSTSIIINGFITGPDGVKMSKSLGNVISPFDVIDTFKEFTDYPEDVLRFVLLHDISSFEDGGISMESIKQIYQANLANGIGNLTNRIMRMATTNNVLFSASNSNFERYEINNISYGYDINTTLRSVMAAVKGVDEYIAQTEPFKLIKIDNVKGKEIILETLFRLEQIAKVLEYFVPNTSAKILECIRENKMPEKPLFNRLP